VPIRVTEPYRGVEGAALYEAVDASGAPIPGRKATLVGMIHGNEIVGEAVLSRIEREVEADLAAGSVLLVRATLEGQRLNKRHTPDGTDINRLWDAERQQAMKKRDPATLCYEERRALEIAPLLVERDAILDLHSTSRPAPPFLVFRDDQAHADLARRLGIPFLVTGLHEGAILDGGVCPDVGLWPGDRSPRLGFTFESGQHLDPVNVERAYAVALRFLHHLGVWRHAPPVPADTKSRVYEVVDRMVQVPRGAEPWRFVGYAGGEPGGGRNGPPRPLASFDEIQADEMILRKGRTTVVRAQTPFTMLLPTPTADPGTDLFYVTQQRPTPREALLTHEEARQEAKGIERMLDLLDDDEYARGTSRASFDARQVLDLCADAVARTLRLPEGHPHRRVTVVGRGDWGGDETERRAGQKYRQAMRAALSAGVPIERFQLLSGAALGWFRVLTTRAMGRLMERRKGAGGLRLWLSARQPDTVSVLVVGDLARALAEGDYRHVRVGLVVEAATVEPEGADARVRIARAGIFSARPEMLHAATRLLESLSDDHRWLTSAPPFDRPELRALFDADGAIAPRGDASLETLRAALLTVQLASWREALQGQLTPRRLADDEEIGRWLARTMAASGILDADALKAMLLTRDADTGAVWVDATRLEEAASAPERVDVRRLAPSRPPGRGAPPQPLVADDVDADLIERWIGWKRLVRGAQLIPDVRGKDLDVAFDESAIAGRAGSLLRAARELAAQRPGEVMVVVAGRGPNPSPERQGGVGFIDAHGEVVMDPRIRYLRLQHGPGTHLSWLRGLFQLVGMRPSGGQPVGIQWESTHGTSMNVLLVATRDPDAPDRPWSLDGWSVDRCSVLLSPLRGAVGRDSRVGLFTEPLGPDRRVNHDLLHFARAYCEGLLSQEGPRAWWDGQVVPDADEPVVAQIASWLERARGLRRSGEVPDDAQGRARWVASALGLADPHLAAALADALESGRPAGDVARAIWRGVEAWTSA
jgi:predicted deacylase